MNHLGRHPIRIRHQLERRQLQVARVERLSPRLRRIVPAGEKFGAGGRAMRVADKR